MTEKNIYLFIGEDSVSKDRKLAAIKKDNLQVKSQPFDTFATRKPRPSGRGSTGSLSINPESFGFAQDTSKDAERDEAQTSGFGSTALTIPSNHPRCVEWVDFECLRAGSLEASKLKELLYSLPAISKTRIIVIKEADKLSLQNKKILLSFAKTPFKDTLLILDSNKPEIKDIFFQEFSRFARVLKFFSKPSLNIFDLGRTIASKKSKEALLCLSRLLENGEKHSNILGVIGWQWRKLRREMPEQEFLIGLQLLQEADLNIKRSRLKGDLALEILIVKLCAPVSC